MGSPFFTSRDLTPDTHWIRIWVNPKIGLDAVKKRKMLSPLEIEPWPSRPSHHKDFII
jgi:hypothetical protein